MEITARLTGNATVNTLSNNRQVVNFTVASNDRYSLKQGEAPVQLVTFIQCDYWRHTAIAAFLTKGQLVELQGRIGASAYQILIFETPACLFV